MLRSGLFSSAEFGEASKGFVLLRLKPGPAESRFGITAAPMAAMADWHGRVVIPSLNLRGDIGRACRLLTSALSGFDRKNASRPPYEIPEFARPFLAEDGEAAVARFLGKVHPRKRGAKADDRSFGRLAEVYRGLEGLGEQIRLVQSYVAACDRRVPEYGEDPAGYGAEVALLVEMTWCPNDRIKFMAIQAYGRFAPVSKVGFLVTRADRRAENCRNPNVVLVNCMAAIGETAKRFPGVTDRASALDRRAILDTLPALTGVLETEGRNNGACAKARDSIVAIAGATGAPDALGAYLANLKAPGADSEWMRKFTNRYHEASLAWLHEVTGKKFGADYGAWKEWFDENRDRLHYAKGRFVVNASAAKAYRERLAKAMRRR